MGIFLFVLGIAALVLFVVVLVTTNDNDEDRRELREFGGMQCVYNVTEDVIEECTRAPG